VSSPAPKTKVQSFQMKNRQGKFAKISAPIKFSDPDASRTLLAWLQVRRTSFSHLNARRAKGTVRSCLARAAVRQRPSWCGPYPQTCCWSDVGGGGGGQACAVLFTRCGPHDIAAPAASYNGQIAPLGLHHGRWGVAPRQRLGIGLPKLAL